MVKNIFGLFLVLHGLVHLLYLGQSQGIFELQQGMDWPDGSWTFSKLLGDGPTRMLTGVFLVVAAAGFAAGGAGLFLTQAWWRPVVISAAVFSSLVYLLLWDGTARHLDNQGAVGILINVAILAVVLGFQGLS